MRCRGSFATMMSAVGVASFFWVLHREPHINGQD